MRLLFDYTRCLLFLSLLALCFSCKPTTYPKGDGNQTEQRTVSRQDKRNSNATADLDLPLPIKDRPEQILFRKAYVVSYNKETRTPNWVAWLLTADHTSGKAKRPNRAFHEDEDVPTPRADFKDYKDSPWSRGHICPAGDNKWDAEAMYESFLMTNICPQDRSLNSGVWNQIEVSCRRWAEKYGAVTIVSGPVWFNREHERIGANAVAVPEAFFKVVLCTEGHPKAIGFICKNNGGGGKRDLYVNSVSEVERITGITFFPHLDPDVSSKVKQQAELNDW